MIKRKHDLSTIHRKKIEFSNRLKYAEEKTFCLCVEVYRNYERNDFDKIYEVFSTLKNKKLKINKILIEKYKDMLENPDFEEIFWSKAAEGIYQIGHGSIRLMKRLIYYDRFFRDNLNYFDLRGSVCKYLNEISKW